VGGVFALVTDNGKFVVLVVVSPALSGTMEVLRIFQQSGGNANLVRSVRLNEIWTGQQLEQLNSSRLFTDSSPQWFAGGELGFSSDSTQLIHKTKRATR